MKNKRKVKKLKSKVDYLERRLGSSERFRENMYSNQRFLEGKIAAFEAVLDLIFSNK